MYTSSNIITAG